jgi:Tol biopolymer transport system component
MKRLITTGLILTLAAALAGADEKKANVLLQAAMAKETVQGDLKGAIALYESAAKEAGQNRALAVKSLLKAAECYQKLGDSESRKMYERIVRDYADQKDAVAMARARLGSSGTAVRGAMSARRVWARERELDGDLYDATISPDGRYVPFTNWSQNGNLYLHDLTTGANRQLTNTGAGSRGGSGDFGAESAFSRDGKQLAYTWWFEKTSRAQLRVIDLQGSGIPQPRTLYEHETLEWIAPEDWSPDGNQIAVQIRRTDRTAQIGFVSVADGSLRVLKSVDWRISSGMFFSPDGRHLVFDSPVSDNRDQRDVFIIAADGSREIPAVVDPANDTVMGWSSDGKFILFASDRSGSKDLWALPLTDGKPTGSPLRLKTEIGSVTTPKGFSRSGALYYNVFSPQFRTDVRTGMFDFRAESFVETPAGSFPEFGGSTRLPSWSPGGKFLAYIAQPQGTARHQTLVVRATDTGQHRILRVTVEFITNIRWSPDGQYLAVAGRDFKGREGLHRVDAQTGDIALIAEGSLREPLWSPDGKRIYYVRPEKDKSKTLVARELASGVETALFSRTRFGLSNLSPDGQFVGITASDNIRSAPDTLFLVPTAGGEARELIRRPGGLGAVNFSPDGRYIATRATDPTAKSIIFLLIPTFGGGPRELQRVPDSMTVSFFMWTPDSRAVYLKSSQLNLERTEVWSFPVDGSAGRKLDINADHIWGFVLSPDRRHIAYVRQSGPTTALSAEVWVLENFLPVTAPKP